MKGLNRWRIKNGVEWNVKGSGGSNECNCRVRRLGKGEGLRVENQAEGCEFLQPLGKNSAKIGDPGKLHCDFFFLGL